MQTFTDEEILAARKIHSDMLGLPDVRAARQQVHECYADMCREGRSAAARMRAFERGSAIGLSNFAESEEAQAQYHKAHQAYADLCNAKLAPFGMCHISIGGLPKFAPVQDAKTRWERCAILAHALFPPREWGRSRYPVQQDRINAWRSLDLQGRPQSTAWVEAALVEWEALVERSKAA